jgi:glycosyltransferase involved in cell wall biosynthesis
LKQLAAKPPKGSCFLNNELEFTILMPCLNEAETLAVCIGKARSFLAGRGISGEVLVADNGSTDGSQKIAADLGARVVSVPERGYGAALIGGCEAAYGKYIIMGDADDSYDFTNLMPFVERLRAGDDLVMGNRFKGGLKKGAMPPLHRYLGNPVLSAIGRLFFKCPIRDFHCGLRGYNAARMRELDLRTTGMEYASEMVVQAQVNGYRISEVPTTLSPDGRSRPPHLRSWRDGWRHLKFLLMHCPNWLFLYPGIVIVLIGLVFGVMIEASAVNFFGAMLDINTLLYCAVMVIVGFNLISFHAYAKVYAINAKFIRVKKTFAEKIDADSCALAGIFSVFIGTAITVVALILWGREGFGALNPETFMRITIPSATFISVGVQLVFSGFFIDILRIRVKTSPNES